MSSSYVYYEDDFQPKGPSLFRRMLDLFMFAVAVHAFFFQFIALSVSCLWVSYLIYKALKTNDKEKQVDLLCASIVFNMVYFVEFLAWWILRFIPLYYELKILMFIWLLHPKTRGASLIFNNFITPAFDSVSKRVDYSSAKMDKLISPYLESSATAIQDKYEQAKNSSVEVKPDPNALLEKADAYPLHSSLCPQPIPYINLESLIKHGGLGVAFHESLMVSEAFKISLATLSEFCSQRPSDMLGIQEAASRILRTTTILQPVTKETKFYELHRLVRKLI